MVQNSTGYAPCICHAKRASHGLCILPRSCRSSCFFFQAEDGIRDLTVTGVQTCALPIFSCRTTVPKRQGGGRKLTHAVERMFAIVKVTSNNVGGMVRLEWRDETGRVHRGGDRESVV